MECTGSFEWLKDMWGWKLWLRNLVLFYVYFATSWLVEDPDLILRKFERSKWGFEVVYNLGFFYIPMTVDIAWLFGVIALMLLMIISPGFQSFFENQLL
jgi:hypothetical protein